MTVAQLYISLPLPSTVPKSYNALLYRPPFLLQTHFTGANELLNREHCNTVLMLQFLARRVCKRGPVSPLVDRRELTVSARRF
jgi:hypothetical protein